ncbi:hypothetical protein [Rhodococcus sp. B50]|uniref:hypothetical protein n=1 Tax=Rhodococcus sp. B50 TaxID=2682847 RepID=UPI001BD40F8D|nr:hypothetical protein [Rhodococcus sp. B50]MBS9375356.1 hypothetical protein [Rhodococcus sp. B50]
MTLPAEVSMDAWTGSIAATGPLADTAVNWGARRGLPHSQKPLAFDAPADPSNWRHHAVGYGVLLLDDPAVSGTAKATGEDAPSGVLRILKERPGTVLLRWSPELEDRYLRRYTPDGHPQDLLVGLTKFGAAQGNFLPRYVLVAGGPEVIPWSVQYSLSIRHAVGRLPFSDERLDRYVDALLRDWSGSAVDVTAPLLWTVDHGPTDITRLMRAAVTAPLDKAFDGTLDGRRHLTDDAATSTNLLESLERNPALVVTSSHGATPTSNPELLRATLGTPVDTAHTATPVDDLAAAMPSGAVWFAQACCSAGGAGSSSYDGLLGDGSAAAVVRTVAGLGPVVAPAALRLLSRDDPVRAVIGHVEPTFDWTLRADDTGQLLGGTIVQALSSNIHHGQPLGYAFGDYRAGVGQLHTDWAQKREQLAKGDMSVLPLLTRLRLTAVDRQSMVLLGDPTVTLPPLP